MIFFLFLFGQFKTFNKKKKENVKFSKNLHRIHSGKKVNIAEKNRFAKYKQQNKKFTWYLEEMKRIFFFCMKC